MRFIKFSSLENTYRQNEIDRVVNHGLSKVEWMATEKIHGANFAIYCDGENIKLARRTAFLEDGESFYDSKRVAGTVEEAIKEITNRVRRDLSEFAFRLGYEFAQPIYCIAYGELFGGSIQKNMPYPDVQDFILFDFVTVVHKDDIEFINKMFNNSGQLNIVKGLTLLDDVNIILAPSNKIGMFKSFESLGVKTAPVLHVGTLDECLAVSNDFVSTLTDFIKVNSLGLSESDRQLRLKAEGVVIEPVEGTFIQQSQVYLKNRSAKFEEKKTEKRVPLTQKLEADLSAKGVFALEGVSERVCENRLDSVLSKLGEVTIRDFNKVLGLLVQDAIEDFEKDELFDVDTKTVGSLRNYLDKEYKSVVTIVTSESKKMVRDLLLKL